MATPSPVDAVALHVVARGLLREDQPVVEELAGDLLRGIDVAAGVVAQVEDDLVGALVEQLGRPAANCSLAGAEKPFSAM